MVGGRERGPTTVNTNAVTAVFPGQADNLSPLLEFSPLLFARTLPGDLANLGILKMLSPTDFTHPI